MLHSKHITYSAGATEATATKINVKVNKGVISIIFVSFPPGCAGLVKLRMSLDGSPILPVDSDAFINGDAYVFEYPIFIEIDIEPQTIEILGWNEDELYDHTIDIQFMIVDKHWIQPAGASEGVIAALRSMFERR